MKLKSVLTAAAVSVSLFGFSQKNTYWKPVSSSESSRLNAGKEIFSASFRPFRYTLFTLDENVMKPEIRKAPQVSKISSRNSRAIISVPVGNGIIEKFSVSEYSVMMPALQAKYPELRSYVGQGIDNPARSIRCDFTPEGFHATIRTVGENTVYVNPVNRENKLYAVYARNENDKSENRLQCKADGIVSEDAARAVANKTAPVGNVDDGQIRQYRMALCTTGEFSRVFTTGATSTQDSINKVMAAITTDLTRLNQVYEIDLGIHIVFVDNEDTLIFLNPATDPFTSANLNSACQKTCDSRIGDVNYDVGHVLYKGTNDGNAGCIGCVCTTGKKGSGYTTYSNPTLTDYFVIDYWTHEVGHQFGANHTYTYVSEGTAVQIEPGSGSTIMGYAGITGATDVQPHSDDYFSCASIAQISNYIESATGGGRCDVPTVTGNHAPTVGAGAARSIPKSTPFTLTGTASDADASNVLSYCWEQVDAFEKGANKYPKPASTKGPLFRSFNYVISKSRTFPSLSTILNGDTATKWEALPAVARDMNFRFTARDNKAGAGQNKSADVLITVVATAGPFRITAPNTSTVSWKVGTTQTVTWSVNKTNVAPINCTNVKISLSTDGGNTFPVVLAANTPNDGSQSITVPNNVTTKARIKVEAIGNIFFDISNADFKITAAQPLAATASALNSAGSVSAQPNPAKDFTTLVFNHSAENVIVRLSDISGKNLQTVNLKSVTAGQTYNVNLSAVQNGTYFINITDNKGSYAVKVIVSK